MERFLKVKQLLIEKRIELVRFVKFCVVGTIGTLIDFGLLNLFYNVLGWPQVLSNVLSTSAAVVNNYTWSRYWVYPETRNQQGGKKFIRFVIVSLIAVVLNTTLLRVTDGWVFGARGILAAPVAALAGLLSAPHSVLSSNLAKAFATGVVLFWNFFANRIWTFSDVDHVPSPAVGRSS